MSEIEGYDNIMDHLGCVSTENTINDEDDEGEIDISKIGQRDPMPELLAAESRSTKFFLFGKYYDGMSIRGKFVKDYNLSGPYFAAALEYGIWEAAFYLGELYYDGLGVRKNYERAFKFYEKGAKMDHGESLYKVGWCLSSGHGTEWNEAAAIRYFKLTYEPGSAEGASFYGWCLLHGQMMKANPKKAFKL